MQPDLDTFPQQELPARATQLDAQAADAVHALDHDELYDFQHPSSVHKSALAGRHLAPSQAAGHPGHWPDTPLLGTFMSELAASVPPAVASGRPDSSMGVKRPSHSSLCTFALRREQLQLDELS